MACIECTTTHPSTHCPTAEERGNSAEWRNEKNGFEVAVVVYSCPVYYVWGTALKIGQNIAFATRNLAV